MDKIYSPEELREYTREVWQPYYDEPLTDQDCDEIKDNMTQFINVLIEMRKDREEKEQENVDKKSGKKCNQPLKKREKTP